MQCDGGIYCNCFAITSSLNKDTYSLTQWNVQWENEMTNKEEKEWKHWNIANIKKSLEFFKETMIARGWN